jgi:hypothetical protein
METCKALYKAPSCAITCCPVRLFLHSAIHLKFSIIPLASSDNSKTRTQNLEGATANINCNDVLAFDVSTSQNIPASDWSTVYNYHPCVLHTLFISDWESNISSKKSQVIGHTVLTFLFQRIYKVVQIWPGLFVCKQVTVCPGHIWTTLYYK